jgi:hypothetical protein
LVAGLTVILGEVAPVDHKYPLKAGVVDKVVLLPAQIGFRVAITVGVGNGLTVTVRLADPMHPLASATLTE